MDRKGEDEGEVALHSEEVLAAPKSTVFVTMYPSERFACSRVYLLPLPDPKWWRLRCVAIALVRNFVNFFGNVAALFLNGEKAIWAPFYVPPPDDRTVLDVKIAGLSQMRFDGAGMPAEVFYEMAMMDVALNFDESGPSRYIALVVMNRSDKPLPVSFVAKGRPIA